jgi:hypothetical protein
VRQKERLAVSSFGCSWNTWRFGSSRTKLDSVNFPIFPVSAATQEGYSDCAFSSLVKSLGLSAIVTLRDPVSTSNSLTPDAPVFTVAGNWLILIVTSNLPVVSFLPVGVVGVSVEDGGL